MTGLLHLPPMALLVLGLLALGNLCVLAVMALLYWRGLPIGTKSVLVGAHCFWLHPWFVALAWWKLYSFPWDPRLWVCFMVHDLGYWGLPNMDGPEGEYHVVLGAKVCSWLFDDGGWDASWFANLVGRVLNLIFDEPFGPHVSGAVASWYQFNFYHSRYKAKQYGIPPSRLCYADKLAFVITPAWLYKFCVRLTGEWREYARAHNHEVHHDAVTLDGWYRPSRDYVRRWVTEFSSGERSDTWTQSKPAVN